MSQWRDSEKDDQFAIISLVMYMSVETWPIKPSVHPSFYSPSWTNAGNADQNMQIVDKR